MIKALSILSIIALSLFTQAEKSYPIQERIKTVEYKVQVHPLIFSPKIQNLNTIKNALSQMPQEEEKDANLFLRELSPFFPKSLMTSLFYWRFVEPNPEHFKKVLTYSFLAKILVIRDLIDNPQTPNPHALTNIMRTLTDHSGVTTEAYFSKLMPLFKEKADLIGNLPDSITLIEALKNTKIVSTKLKTLLNSDRLYSLSALGLIPGNYVELISENRTDIDRINWLNQKVLFNGGVLDFDSPYVQMPMRPSDDGHPVFREDPIFEKIRDMILMAKETIFIDIHLLGGTTGATLAEFLIDQSREKIKHNPNFKVLLIHNGIAATESHSILEEVTPILKYISREIQADPKLKSNVEFHLSNKQDHSKVIVIDGNTKEPKAYFGSKNWTDHDGAYYFDDAIYVEGPAAAIVQASYYHDMKELGLKESTLKHFAITRNTIPYRGRSSVRLAETSLSGTLNNTRNTLIDMIINAKRSIYMEQLYLYDPYVVDTLIKKRIENSKMDIKILLDQRESLGMNGFPNTIFLRELKAAGIELRARKTIGVLAKFPNGEKVTYHQENHRKITCVDGQIILGGSSNVTPDALKGKYREFGAQIFSRAEGKNFDRMFIKDWHDPKKVVNLDVENFQAVVKERRLSKRNSSLINDISALLLRSVDL